MADWNISEIRKVAKFNPKESLPKGSLAKKFPMDSLTAWQRKIGDAEIEAYNGGAKFRNGDTLLAKITPCLENGKTAYVDILDENEIAFGSTEFIVLRATKEADSLFIYYFARSPAFRKRAIGCMEGTSGRKRVNENALQLCELPCPPKEEQRKIAEALSALDAKIDLNQRINTELEALAKAIYDYWFVQFDFPDTNGRPYKSSGGKMVWNEVLKREIPEGWKIQLISAWIAKQKSGEWGTDSAVGDNDAQVTCIRGADINALNGSGELNAPTRYVPPSKIEKYLAPYDLVVEISGGSPTQSTGRAALVSPEVIERFNVPLVCSNFCKALTLNDATHAFHFLQQWNALYTARVFFGWEGKTSGIKNLQFDSFVGDYRAPVPPEALSHRFHELCSSLDQRKQSGLRENHELTQLRNWLLPLLMNGQVRVA